MGMLRMKDWVYTLWGPGFYVHRKYWRAMRSPWLLRVCRACHFTSTHTSNIVAIDVVLQGTRRWVLLTFIRHTEREEEDKACHYCVWEFIGLEPGSGGCVAGRVKLRS